MEPTPSPASSTAPPAVGQGLVEYVRGNRQNAAIGFLGLGAFFVVLAVFLAFKAFTPPAPKTPDKPLTEKAADEPEKKDAKPAETEAQILSRTQFSLGWVAALAAAGVAGAAGSWLSLRPVAPAESDQRSEARVLLLAVGGLIGAVLIVLGCAYFYLWSDSLTKWLNQGEVRESRWVLIPLMMVVTGAGLVFVAIQPARAEERNSQLVRKLVYGSNFGLTVLLLLVALLVANVVFSLKVPNKLDATATGFYTISNTTKDLLSRLTEPVKAYAILPPATGREANDIRQLLLACKDASNGKFDVKFLSQVANGPDISALQKKYPQLDLVLNQRGMSEDEVEGAVVLTTGEDEKRHAVIPAREFSLVESRQAVFQGEARLFKELAFLGDSQTRPNVYFTQGHGELSIEAAQGVRPTRSASRLKTYLENSYFSVKPLTLAGESPTVPDDATVVVVADPTDPLPAPAVSALRKYMNNPAKKGKMVVLAGANVGADRKMLNNGLEPLLAEMNVKLGTRFIYNFPTSQQFPFINAVLAQFSPAAEDNPILQAIASVSPRMQLTLPREVVPLTTSPGIQATDLMLSTGLTWPEDEAPADLRAVVAEMAETLRAQEAKGVSRAPRSLAAIVSEGQTGRAVVIGSSIFVSDEAARQHRSQSAPLSFDLIGMSIDWLRDKPSIAAAGIEAKKYSEYRFPRMSADGTKEGERKSDVDETRLKYLPLGLAFLTVVGLGAGVWVVRRR